MREALSQIWLKLFELFSASFDGKGKYDKNDERLKEMLIYIHEHFADKNCGFRTCRSCMSRRKGMLQAVLKLFAYNAHKVYPKLPVTESL